MEEEVTEEECKKYAQSLKAKMAYTSAKADKKGFNRFLINLLKDYIEKYMNKKVEIKEEKSKKIVLEDNNRNSKKRKKKCC